MTLTIRAVGVDPLFQKVFRLPWLWHSGRAQVGRGRPTRWGGEIRYARKVGKRLCGGVATTHSSGIVPVEGEPEPSEVSERSSAVLWSPMWGGGYLGGCLSLAGRLHAKAWKGSPVWREEISEGAG
jgi:hypothetical protein